MPVHQTARTDRDAARARVLEFRRRGRRRSTPVRAARAALGAVLLVVCVPGMVVLPELAVPGTLVALRLLAVEADWAARAYAWLDWRFAQGRAWFHRQSRPVRWSLTGVFLLAAAALVWLLVAGLL